MILFKQHRSFMKYLIGFQSSFFGFCDNQLNKDNMEIYTILLITSDKSGSVMAMLQSSHSPQIPRIIIAGSPDALKDAWGQKQNGLIFYYRIYTFLPYDQELMDMKKQLGIEDGFYEEEKLIKKCRRCGGTGNDPYYLSHCRNCGGSRKISQQNNNTTSSTCADIM